MPTRIRTAQVRRSHGVRGAVRVEPLGGGVERFNAGLRLMVEGDGREVTVCESRTVSSGDLLIEFEGIATRDEADRLRGRYLTVDVAAARPLGKDEWFVDTVIGLRAVTPEGAEVGVVADVESYPANDVLVIRGADRERRMPMVKAFVQSVEPALGTITVTPWDEED